jgi:hypothetical protein
VRRFLEDIRPHEVESLNLLVSLGPAKIHVMSEWIDNRLFWAKGRRIGKWVLVAFLAIVSGTAVLVSNAQTIYTVVRGVFPR